MKDPAAEFLRYLDLQRGASRHTLRGYATDLAEFHAYLSREGMGDIAHADARAVRAWVAHLHDRKLAKSSIARKLATGKLRRSRTRRSSMPTAPVAPTIAM